jgi:hypothetical protein
VFTLPLHFLIAQRFSWPLKLVSSKHDLVEDERRVGYNTISVARLPQGSVILEISVSRCPEPQIVSKITHWHNKVKPKPPEP